MNLKNIIKEEIVIMDFNIENIEEQLNNRDFDEYPACCICGSNESQEKIIAEEGSRIVECPNCKLWFTSPRLDEKKWEFYLRNESSERNKKFTENRLNYGVALSKNIHKQPKDWRKVKRAYHEKIYKLISKWSPRPVQSIHEVGCGVGFFLEDMDRKGIKVTGNDLNGYACKIMKEKLGLTVWNCNFKEAPLTDGSLDVITMHDYIEHTYHPFIDIKEAHRVLVPEGVIYIQTFMIDSDPFNSLGGKWNMLWWNHVYHFSTQSLVRMVETAGFKVKMVLPSLRKGLISVIAKKQ